MSTFIYHFFGQVWYINRSGLSKVHTIEAVTTVMLLTHSGIRIPPLTVFTMKCLIKAITFVLRNVNTELSQSITKTFHSHWKHTAQRSHFHQIKSFIHNFCEVTSSSPAFFHSSKNSHWNNPSARCITSTFFSSDFFNCSISKGTHKCIWIFHPGNTEASFIRGNSL